MTRLSAKTLKNRNLYVRIVYFPGRRKTVAARRTSRRPFAAMTVGEELRVARRCVRIRAIAHRVEHHDGTIQHITEIFTRSVSRKRARTLSNVVKMPRGDGSKVAEFLRFHVLVRVFDGDPDAWLSKLREREEDSADVRFARWIRSRLRQDPALLGEIRRMVDATPFWRAAQA
ncbi:MAG: hypothetical protein M3P06_22520 [Acidobacteriota bacterium]|nr:hypothetical protein [Acidobacteriota bacterium]